MNIWTEIVSKIGDKLRAAVAVMVVLDPDCKTISVYRENEEQTLLRIDDTLTIPDLLAGFAMPVRQVF